MGNEPSVEAINLLTEMFRERIAQPESNSIESWAKRVLTETNAIDFAALATENTDLKRQLAASANAYGSLQQENERLKGDVDTYRNAWNESDVRGATLRTELQQARADAEACNVATEEVQKEIVRAREENAQLKGEFDSGDDSVYNVRRLRKQISDLAQQLAQSQAEADKWKITAESHCVVIMDHESERDALQRRLDAAVGLMKECSNVLHEHHEISMVREGLFDASGSCKVCKRSDIFTGLAAFLAAQRKEKP